MTQIEYDEATDGFYFHCYDCGHEGRVWNRRRDAELDADWHDEQHDDGLI